MRFVIALWLACAACSTQLECPRPSGNWIFSVSPQLDGGAAHCGVPASRLLMLGADRSASSIACSTGCTCIATVSFDGGACSAQLSMACSGEQMTCTFALASTGGVGSCTIAAAASGCPSSYDAQLTPQ